MNSIAVPIEGIDQVSAARRAAVAVAKTLQFDETESGRVAVVVSECATNVFKHARRGEILLRATDRDGQSGLEVLALDKGPGMSNIGMCLRDGYSTAGSAGTGLGAIERLSSQCDIYTVEGKGTALLAKIWKNHKDLNAPPRHETGAVCVPKAGEEACGDDWGMYEGPEFTNIFVVDGLGHGVSAADCAVLAMQAFYRAPGEEPVGILENVHAALRASRGAAVAVARLDSRERIVRFAGIGNIAGAIQHPQGLRQMISVPGISGHDMRRVREFTYAWPEGAIVLLYSDGLASHWSLDSYAGLLSRDPSLLAGVLYRDWSRGRRDDTTVIAVRERAA
jgi:anti-sigma regulatory factor (Ser/Thr protein kinase)